MKNNKDVLLEAAKYLRKYKGINEYIIKYGINYPVSIIISYLYKFREIESFGYDLEDIFMEVYMSIWDRLINGKNISNISRFIKQRIVDCIKDDFIDASQNKLMKLDVEDFEFLEMRKNEYDLNKEIDKSSNSFIQDIDDKDVVTYIFNNVCLKRREKQMLIKYFNGKTIYELADEFNISPQRILFLNNRSLRKIRTKCYLNYLNKDDILYPRE